MAALFCIITSHFLHQRRAPASIDALAGLSFAAVSGFSF
jgi:hypothetical protein